MYVRWGHVCEVKTCMWGEDSIREVDQLCTLVSHWRGRGSFFYRLGESLRSWSSAVAGVRAVSGFLAGSQTVFSGCWAPPGLSPVSCWDESERPCLRTRFSAGRRQTVSFLVGSTVLMGRLVFISRSSFSPTWSCALSYERMALKWVSSVGWSESPSEILCS